MDNRRDAALSGAELLDAVHGWKPDASCIAAGDKYVGWAVRAWAAAGLSDAQIEDRVRALVPETETSIMPFDAAVAVVRHCAFARVPPREITGLLVQLASGVPDWRPTDPDDIADLVTAVVMREARHGH